MKHQFTPMRVIRLSSADAFSSLAAASGGDAAVARLDPPVYWNESDGTLRRQLLFRLQEVHDLVAHEEGGLLVAMEEAAAVGVAVDFTDCESAYDRAIRLLLHHPDLAHKALRFARADGLESSRYWVTRPGMPEGAVDFSKDALGELKHAVGGFYRSKEGRGDYQHIEHLVRTDAAHYFFVFLSDFPQRSDDFADDGHLTPRATRPGFEVVFAYHPDTRSLHTYARGGNKIIQPLHCAARRNLFVYLAEMGGGMVRSG